MPLTVGPRLGPCQIVAEGREVALSLRRRSRLLERLRAKRSTAR